MRIIIQIPVKANSERIPKKNLQEIGGKSLLTRVMELAASLPRNWDIVLDTDLLEPEWAMHLSGPAEIRKRALGYEEDWCNGNHLLGHLFHERPHYDLYGQLFATAPFLTRETVVAAFQKLADHPSHDSLITGTYQGLFVWQDGHPNYVPGSPAGFGRLQDRKMFVESTGLYIIRKEAIRNYGTRTGMRPLLFEIPEKEAFDIDTPWQLKLARQMTTL